MTIEGLIGLVDHIKESTAPREERAAVDHLSSALNTLGSSFGDSSGAARAGSEPATLGQAAVERRVHEEARRAQQEVEELRRLVQRRKEEAQRGNKAVRRSNERIQELRRQLDGGGDRHAHITY